MNDPNAEPFHKARINPYASNPYGSTLDDAAASSVRLDASATGPVAKPIIGAGEIIGNAIIGVGVSGATLGFLNSLLFISWNLDSFEPGMITMPLIGIVIGFSCGGAAGMFIVPIVYCLFSLTIPRTWTPRNITRFGATSGFSTCVVVSLFNIRFTGLVSIAYGFAIGILAAYVTARVLQPLRKLLAKRIAQRSAQRSTGQSDDNKPA